MCRTTTTPSHQTRKGPPVTPVTTDLCDVDHVVLGLLRLVILAVVLQNAPHKEPRCLVDVHVLLSSQHRSKSEARNQSWHRQGTHNSSAHPIGSPLGHRRTGDTPPPFYPSEQQAQQTDLGRGLEPSLKAVLAAKVVHLLRACRQALGGKISLVRQQHHRDRRLIREEDLPVTKGGGGWDGLQWCWKRRLTGRNSV